MLIFLIIKIPMFIDRKLMLLVIFTILYIYIFFKELFFLCTLALLSRSLLFYLSSSHLFSSGIWSEGQLFIFVSGAQFDTRCQMMCQNVHNLPYAGPAKSCLMSRWAMGSGWWVVDWHGFYLDRAFQAGRESVGVERHCGVKCVRD